MPGQLTQSHQKYEHDCAQCHADVETVSQTDLCMDCHTAVKADIKTRNGYHGHLSTKSNLTCRNCHSEHLGRTADIVRLNKAIFDHSTTTFALEGRHKSLPCDSCHQGDSKYREAPSDCIGCHKESDTHKGNLGENCGDCHSADGWKSHDFDHSQTDFMLKGKHGDAGCNSCHPDNHFKNISSECVACHSLDDSHSGKYSNQCDICHQETSWQDDGFHHNTDTRFTLTGKHSSIPCEGCHQRPEDFITFETKSCFSCHGKEDIHLGINGKKCQNCHSSKGWSDTKFNHDLDTEFPLTGGHKSVSCKGCHETSSAGESKTDNQCQGCHVRDNIHGNALGDDCQQCHNPSGWLNNIQFNHELTSFPLLGSHALTSCEQCHSTDSTSPTGSACYDCHRESDPHEGIYPVDCSQCHNPNAWNLWLFEHEKKSAFPLYGRHRQADCNDCHNLPLEKMPRTESECYSCHKQDDVHRRRFGEHCSRCHSPDGFNELRIRQQ